MHAQGKGVNAESVLSTRAQQGMRVAKARIAPRLSYESRQSESLAHDFPFPFPFPLSICPYFPHFLSSVVCFLAPRHGKSDSGHRLSRGRCTRASHLLASTLPIPSTVAGLSSPVQDTKHDYRYYRA